MKIKHKLDYAREKTEKIVNSFASSFMNDAKWVKLLEALSSTENLVRHSKVKLVWDDELRDIGIDDDISYDFDFYDHAMEAMISGYPRGWYSYKEIEWIEFPSDDQDVEEIEKAIKKVGKFQLETINGNLRLYGYK